jgi:hypothetical protein
MPSLRQITPHYASEMTIFPLPRVLKRLNNGFILIYHQKKLQKIAMNAK